MASRPSTSPTKGRKSAANANVSGSNAKRNSQFYEEQRGIKQPDVDIEHYKITVDTLTHRCSVVEDQKHQIDQQKALLDKQEHTIDALREENKGLKQQLKLSEETQAQLHADNKLLKATLTESHNAREKIQHELMVATEYMQQLEHKVYEANQTSLDLLKSLKEAESEIDVLKQYIIDLKARIAVYIPVKGDPVDMKLAEFINNYPDRQKLKIMFMRESEGVYEFGSKRVAVKVEKGKINVRVGGGFLSLDEFLDQYTPVELEKLERRDPLKRFSEKVAVQKTIVGKERVEQSPVRNSSPTKSPKKRAI